MKQLYVCLVCLLCVLTSGWTADLEKASVTMPYAELASLLDRVRAVEASMDQVKPESPVAVIVKSAEYRLDCVKPESAILEASFAVSNLSPQWQTVRLVGATEAIRSVEPDTVRLLQREDGVSVLLEPRTDVVVTLGLQLATPSRSRSGQVIADFYSIPAAQSRLMVKHHAEPSAVVVAGAVGANADGTEFSLSALGGSIQVALYEASSLVQTQWNGTVNHLVKDQGSRLEVTSRVRLNATDGGRTSEAHLILPNDVSVDTVQGLGTGQARYTLETTANERIIHMTWLDDVAMTREVLVKYSVPSATSEGNFTMPVLTVANALRLDGFYYFMDSEGVEITPANGEWSALGRVPEWIRPLVGSQSLHFYPVTNEGPVELTARWLTRLQTATATVQRAEYETEVVTEGGRLHSGRILVEHQGAADYVFKLPEGGKLLSCAVGGRAVEPILHEDGSLRLVLPEAGRGDGLTQVVYVFTTKAGKMNPVEGQAQLELPRTPLFIHQLMWTVHLPAEYQATALEGNVVIDAGGADGQVVRLSKQICDDETPVASLYYTRRDLER
ncbi:hypothetical protein ACWPKS_15100 [Coraliomargarita sp. W4R72]